MLSQVRERQYKRQRERAWLTFAGITLFDGNQRTNNSIEL